MPFLAGETSGDMNLATAQATARFHLLSFLPAGTPSTLFPQYARHDVFALIIPALLAVRMIALFPVFLRQNSISYYRLRDDNRR